MEIKNKVEELWRQKGKTVRGNLSRKDIELILRIVDEKKRDELLFVKK